MKIENVVGTRNLVTFSIGEMPILLTAPHGGSVMPEDIASVREERKGYKPRAIETFNIDWDESTYELLFHLANRLHTEIGKRPYIVAARFDRKYVDANRNYTILGQAGVPHENHAYDNPNGKKYYEEYHGKIREYVEDIHDRFKGEGLLFDIHGAIFQDKRIVVGMLNFDPLDFQRHFRRGHISVDKLLEKFGFDPLYHPYSGFLSRLQGRLLPNGLRTEVLPFDRFQRASPAGGYTVMTYGSNRPGGIDAFQLECGLRMRSQWLDAIVEIYADAIQTLYRNVIDAPFFTETIFAGKKQLGSKKRRSKSVTIEFSLQRTPKKNLPITILVHTRRVTGNHNGVSLNGSFLGHLMPHATITSFNPSNSMAILKKNKNEVVISCAPIDGDTEGKIDDFDVVKLNIVYCGAL
jgi:N-formylglutamate amidohydrolase